MNMSAKSFCCDECERSPWCGNDCGSCHPGMTFELDSCVVDRSKVEPNTDTVRAAVESTKRVLAENAWLMQPEEHRRGIIKDLWELVQHSDAGEVFATSYATRFPKDGEYKEHGSRAYFLEQAEWSRARSKALRAAIEMLEACK